MPNNKRQKRTQTPKPRNTQTRDMMLYAAQRGQAPTDKAAAAYRRPTAGVRGRNYLNSED